MKQTLIAQARQVADEIKGIAKRLQEADRDPSEGEIKRIEELETETKRIEAKLEPLEKAEQIRTTMARAEELWSPMETDANKVTVVRRDHDMAIRNMGFAAMGKPIVASAGGGDGSGFEVRLAPIRMEKRLRDLGVSRGEATEIIQRGLTIDPQGRVRRHNTWEDARGETIRDARGNPIRESRAWTATSTDIEDGRVLVPTLFERFLYEYMEYSGGIRMAGPTIMTTDGGEPFDLYLEKTKYTPSGTLEGTETNTGGETLGDFEKITMGAYDYWSKGYLSRNLMTDAAVMVEEYLGRSLGRTLQVKTEMRYQLGSGVAMPKGVFHEPPAAQTINTGAAAAFDSYDPMIAALFGLDPYYIARRQDLKWLMNSPIHGHILQMKHTDGTYIFSPAERARGGDPNFERIMMAYTAYTPKTIAANAVPAGIANLPDLYVIRDVNVIEIMSSAHVRMENNQIVYLGHARTDSKIRDPRAARYIKVAA